MYPTYKKGEHILFCNYINLKKIRRFDIVFFKVNNNLHVKRIIGFPGDKIIFLSNGININNKKVEIPQKIKIIFDKKNESQKNNIEFIVPQNSFFVIGDNLSFSLDSRFYGSIPQSVIYGRPIINLGQE
jgi:signal peptidase I